MPPCGAGHARTCWSRGVWVNSEGSARRRRRRLSNERQGLVHPAYIYVHNTGVYARTLYDWQLFRVVGKVIVSARVPAACEIHI